MSNTTDFRTERLDKTQARKRITQIAHHNPAGIRFSRHALEELKNDNLTTADILNVINSPHSRILCEGEYEHGSYRYRLETNSIMVVVAFATPNDLIVVTAWRKQK